MSGARSAGSIVARGRGRKFSPDRESRIAALYEAGSTSEQLALEFGCSIATIRLILKRGGIRPRRPGARVKRAQDIRIGGALASELAARHASGTTQAQIAKDLGISAKWVSRGLICWRSKLKEGAASESH